ncbi:MAG: nucleotidyltransferase domain-containing protein [Caldisericia bacterium]|nr:nucleotidyltransferase domain-containing protein [Caldisericia bacterium]
MIYSIQELKDKIYLIVRDQPVYSVILFGSYVKGIADSNSDIDLVIDSHGQLKGFDYFALLESLTETFCKKIDLISKEQIVKESKIDEIVKNEGIVIYERKG